MADFARHKLLLRLLLSHVYMLRYSLGHFIAVVLKGMVISQHIHGETVIIKKCFQKSAKFRNKIDSLV